MEFFNNARSVRLLGDTGKYMVAQEERETVKLDRKGLKRTAWWIVERDVHQDRIRLRSCFGKYLTASMEPLFLGVTGKKVTQTLSSRSGYHKQYWRPSRAGLRVKLQAAGGGYLRALGGLPPWRNNVTHTTDPIIYDELLWVVEVLEFCRSDSPQQPVGSSIPSSSSTENSSDEIKALALANLNNCPNDYKAEVVKKFQEADTDNSGDISYDKNSAGQDMELMVATSGERRTRKVEHVFTQSKITGLTEDIEKIVGWITKSDMPCRVGIVGVGGGGKTTIAQKIFTDKDVVAHYDDKIWISVSKAFGPEDIWRSILEQYGSHDWVDVNKAKQKIQEYLNNKKSLIVIDDVWRMDYDWWKDISKFLSEMENGIYSIIIITRLENVAREMGATLFHQARKLDENESWSLFYRTVYPLKQIVELDCEIETVGKVIVEKCAGVPLAIKIIAGLLLAKTHSWECWKEISKEFCQELENNTSVFACLEVSYNNLPAMLKPCLLSFSIYPEDAEISAEQLVYWWVGEGFCQENDNKTAIEVGCQRLSELVKRCFVDVVERTSFDRRVYTCKMHDMVRQFVIKMSKLENFSRFDGGNRHILDAKSRHLGYSKETDVSTLNGKSALCALLLVENCPFSLQDTRLDTCDTIQVLDLSKMKEHSFTSMDLLGWIKSQKHLAYLNLQRVSELKKLPCWIRRRQNLQILVLRDCKNLKRLPLSVTKLQNLVVLDVEKCPLATFPTGLKALSKLQVLSGFKLKTKGKGDASLHELINLRELRTLNIMIRMDDQIVHDEDDVNALVKLIQVKILSLEIEGGGSVSARVLDKLVPPPSVQELYLKFFCGDTAPNWITPYLLPDLLYLYIGNGGIRNVSSSFWDVRRRSWKITSLCLEHLGSFELNFEDLQSSLEDLSYVKVTDCQSLQSFPFDVCRSGVWEKETEQNSTEAQSEIWEKELHEIQEMSQDTTSRVEEPYEIEEMSQGRGRRYIRLPY